MASLASLLNGMFEFIITALDKFPGVFEQSGDVASLCVHGHGK